MRKASIQDSRTFRAIAFGLLPLLLGLGGAQLARWNDAVWLTDAGVFWPVTLSVISIAILIKLAFSPFKEMTSSVAAWLTLAAAWFYVPIWITAVEVPYSAAVVDKEGRIYLASAATRDPQNKVWLLTYQTGNRIVRNVSGKLTVSQLGLTYNFADRYIKTRQDGEDVAKPLSGVASAALAKAAGGNRGARIAVATEGPAQDRFLSEICQAVTGGRSACPLKMSLSPEQDATAPGELWSKSYTEKEAIEERHLPTLLQLMTQSESRLVQRDKVFGLVLDNAESIAPLAQLAQKSHLLDDDQFDEVIRRLSASPGCDDAVIAIIAKVNRLSEHQRLSLRAKALAQANLATIVENASRLQLSDAELRGLENRMRTELTQNPLVAVNAIKVFGSRLAVDAQQIAVESILASSAAHALAALENMNFSMDFRRVLLAKIIEDATLKDFSPWPKERLLAMLTPAELRALITMAVRRSEAEEHWLDFALTSLPIRDMTLEERKSLLNGLLFKSPKAALEFVSKNRDYLEPGEVGEITRDYARTIRPDFCLHLSHRNKNWRTNYFSEAQLEIFRQCAGPH
ncbi:MAG: hypothetical protein AB7E81_03820 [Hyphomicrobiaceae bacterium]